MVMIVSSLFVSDVASVVYLLSEHGSVESTVSVFIFNDLKIFKVYFCEGWERKTYSSITFAATSVSFPVQRCYSVE